MADVEGNKDDAKEEKDTKEEEKANATYSVHNNPCRVLPGQEYAMEWDIPANANLSAAAAPLPKRYVPVMPGRKSGIVLMRNLKKGEPEDLVEMQSLATSPTTPAVGTPTARALAQTMQDDDEISPDEVDPPEPFVYTDENDSSDADGDNAGDKDSGDVTPMAEDTNK